MTQLQRLYETADRLGLQIFYFPMGRVSAISTPDGFIGMDVDKLCGSAEELACLAHEMGHYLAGGFYTCDSDLCQQRRCEERADRWAIRRLVPLEELKQAMAAGITQPHELAEHFEVPEDFLRKSLRFYRDAQGAI